MKFNFTKFSERMGHIVTRMNIMHLRARSKRAGIRFDIKEGNFYLVFRFHMYNRKIPPGRVPVYDSWFAGSINNQNDLNTANAILDIVIREKR